MGSYYYENNNIKEEFLDSKAREEAEKIARKGGKKITKTKIRKFYNEVKNYHNRLKEGEDFARIFPLIKMIKAKVSYELGRESGGDIPEEFSTFINENIDKIKDKKDFEAFVLHFEAVLGYYYGLSNRK